METAVLLLISFAVILLGAELFTNGIEWVGRKLDLAEGAVGSVLAAVGTALPETMIPIVAILVGSSEASHAVGIGAILGAPFMLATLAMFVTGTAVVAARRRRPTGVVMDIEPVVVSKDIRFFLLTYGIAIAIAFVPLDIGWVRPATAVVLMLLYVVYVRAHFAAESETGHGGDLAPLRFHRLDRGAHREDPVVPRLRIVNLQVIFALGLIIAGALVFVDAVTSISEGLGLSATLLALVIAPIATELPEKLNSVLWVRQGKDTLAIGNISGAMVFQSCFPVAVALLFAPAGWSIGPESAVAFLSAGIAIVSTIAIFLPMARRSTLTGRGLLIGGAFYVAYLVVVLSGALGSA
jgi:cation:H+ antiporter